MKQNNSCVMFELDFLRNYLYNFTFENMLRITKKQAFNLFKRISFKNDVLKSKMMRKVKKKRSVAQ
jgi:hypothetical protein